MRNIILYYNNVVGHAYVTFCYRDTLSSPVGRTDGRSTTIIIINDNNKIIGYFRGKENQIGVFVAIQRNNREKERGKIKKK